MSNRCEKIGDVEAQNNLGALLDRVEQGEEIVITRHGKPVACLVSSTGMLDHARARAAADGIRDRAQTRSKEAFDWVALKADRDQDRP